LLGKDVLLSIFVDGNSTRLTVATRAMQQARLYGMTNSEVFRQAETTAPSSAVKTLYLTVSSDKGLCGGVHSSLSKATRRISAQEEEQNASFNLVVIGDKSKTQLSRLMPEKFVLSFNQIGKDVPTFTDAQTVADQIFAADVDFDRVEIVYNKFVSMLSYEPTTVTVYSEDIFQKSPKFSAFEIEDDVLTNLKEFALANAIYWALVEGHACEVYIPSQLINPFFVLFSHFRFLRDKMQWRMQARTPEK
jgi:F-type H+-transporting ATPase subunit gamma